MFCEVGIVECLLVITLVHNTMKLQKIISVTIKLSLFIYLFLFILFYFICHTIITKNIGKEEKKKWRGDLTEITLFMYRTL